MVAAGAVLEDKSTGEILVLKRSKNLEHHPDTWEITYGRINQFETVEQGLRREYKEETGIADFEIIKILRCWKIFRGEEAAENELIGITYWCQVNQKPKVIISDEHSEFQWVTPKGALSLIKVEGIQQDIYTFLTSKEEIC